LRRCPAARAASMATRRSSDAMLARNVSYVSCTSWSWARAVSAATSARSSCAGGAQVTMVARGPHLEAIRRFGLAIRSAVEGDSVVRPAAVERLEGVARRTSSSSASSRSTPRIQPRGSGRSWVRTRGALAPERRGQRRQDRRKARRRARDGRRRAGLRRNRGAGRHPAQRARAHRLRRARRQDDRARRAAARRVRARRDSSRAVHGRSPGPLGKIPLDLRRGRTTAVTRETLGVVRETPPTWRLFCAIVEEVNRRRTCGPA